MMDTIFSYASKSTSDSKLRKIIVTLGKEGVAIKNGQAPMTHYKGLPFDQSQITSSIGAGDNFLGGYLFGLVRGKTEE